MKLVAVTFSLVVLGLSPKAMAQRLVSPMPYNEGAGIKVSDELVFHPGVVLEGKYDTNPLSRETDLSGSPYLRVVGHLDLATRPPQRLTDPSGRVWTQKLQFRLKAAFAYREYFSSNEAVRNQRGTEIIGGFNLKYTFSPALAVQFYDDYQRSITAQDQDPTVVDPSLFGTEALRRNDNVTGVRFHVVPGGGRLKLTPGYDFRLSLYENGGFENLNKFHHTVYLNTKWDFYPKTAIALEISQGFVDYFERDASLPQPVNLGSTPLRVLTGLTGLVTPRLTVTLRVGLGAAFYDDLSSINPTLTGGESYLGPIGRAEAKYRIGPTANLKGGFDHDFFDSTYGNYYTDEHVYLDYSQILFGRFVINGHFDYRFRDYAGFDAVNAGLGLAPGAPAAVTELSSHLFDIGAGVDYRIREWIYVGVAYSLQLRAMVDSSNPAAAATTAGLTDFSRHQTTLRVGVSY